MNKINFPKLPNQNRALDDLRRRIPLSGICTMTGKRPCAANHHHRGQKLSKIETLRLARNYLVLLTEMVFYSQSYGDLLTGQILAFGLGQQSLNQLAVLLNINGSIRALGQPSAQVQQIFAKYSFLGKKGDIARELAVNRNSSSSSSSSSSRSDNNIVMVTKTAMMTSLQPPLQLTVAEEAAVRQHHQQHQHHQQQCQSIFADDFK